MDASHSNIWLCKWDTNTLPTGLVGKERDKYKYIYQTSHTRTKNDRKLATTLLEKEIVGACDYIVSILLIVLQDMGLVQKTNPNIIACIQGGCKHITMEVKYQLLTNGGDGEVDRGDESLDNLYSWWLSSTLYSKFCSYILCSISFESRGDNDCGDGDDWYMK